MAGAAQADNVGHKLLSMMGWKEGEGLGSAGAGALSVPGGAARGVPGLTAATQEAVHCQQHLLTCAGRAAPVSAIGEAAGERRGLGTKAHTEIEAGDDEFTRYRKLMMTGYKHRSNPLGNPRKPYSS